jgi:hypothetical protein
VRAFSRNLCSPSPSTRSQLFVVPAPAGIGPEQPHAPDLVFGGHLNRVSCGDIALVIGDIFDSAGKCSNHSALEATQRVYAAVVPDLVPAFDFLYGPADHARPRTLEGQPLQVRRAVPLRMLHRRPAH